MNRNPIKFTVAQIGHLDIGQANNAIGIASSIQNEFDFGEVQQIEFDLSQFRLQNGGFDFDIIAENLINQGLLKESTILLTSDPYGDAKHAEEADYFFFYYDSRTPNYIIISTYLWENDLKRKNIQPYIFYMLGTMILTRFSGLNFHNDTRGCALDYCDDVRDAELSFKQGTLCRPCQTLISKAIREHRLSLGQYAAALKLINQGRGVKECFVAMPFGKYDNLYKKVIKPCMEEHGWTVVRADEIVWPRLVTEAILLHILTADLVVADLTGHNPNVFYEVGLADAAGADMVFILKKGEALPFDVNARRTIFYSQHKQLRTDLSTLVDTERS